MILLAVGPLCQALVLSVSALCWGEVLAWLMGCGYPQRKGVHCWECVCQLTLELGLGGYQMPSQTCVRLEGSQLLRRLQEGAISSPQLQDPAVPCSAALPMGLFSSVLSLSKCLFLFLALLMITPPSLSYLLKQPKRVHRIHSVLAGFCFLSDGLIPSQSGTFLSSRPRKNLELTSNRIDVDPDIV